MPLHHASTGTSTEVVKFLIEKHPEGIKCKGHYGQLPLHCAAASEGSHEVVRFLVTNYPAAISITDDSGDLPLHKACSVGASHEVILLLLDRCDGEDKRRSGLNVTNADGRLPLHCYSSSEGTSIDTLQNLLELHGVGLADKNGILPLHLACSVNHPILDVIRILIDADPYAVVQQSRNGSTPYQLARRM